MKHPVNQLIRALLYPVLKHRFHGRLPSFYPPIVPSDELLSSWQSSEWASYSRFIEHHSVVLRQQWLQLHRQTLGWRDIPFFSIVTPVFNTNKCELIECILSVRVQTLQHWELILVDDGSTDPGTLAVLRSSLCRDPRITVLHADPGQTASGISAASNRAISAAGGDYILFLDHDDRLAPDALQKTAAALRRSPALDMVYSDRDMISPANRRFMHLCKPDWSPETLLSANYLIHLLCLRKGLIGQVGGLRSAYDGAQDHDLLLRCAERNVRVFHVPEILYHHRQSAHSLALDPDAKDYAHRAGARCIEQYLRRKSVQAVVRERKDIWRGNFEVVLSLQKKADIRVIAVDSTRPVRYAQNIVRALDDNISPYVLLIDRAFLRDNRDADQILAAWCEPDDIGMVSGRLVDGDGKIHYAGMFFKDDGRPQRPYLHFPVQEPGYMGVTGNLRNISAPNPWNVLFSFSLWNELRGFDARYRGPYALLDMALRALSTGRRILYQPQACYICAGTYRFPLAPDSDHLIFRQQWQDWLQRGDPYYNPNLSQESVSYELEVPACHRPDAGSRPPARAGQGSHSLSATSQYRHVIPVFPEPAHADLV